MRKNKRKSKQIYFKSRKKRSLLEKRKKIWNCNNRRRFKEKLKKKQKLRDSCKNSRNSSDSSKKRKKINEL